ncbi:MAG TPA: hypothetical protein VFG30_33495 [Polyangiales bacterium]|nr:hypothetical protein [Polyangiales bacterium]
MSLHWILVLSLVVTFPLSAGAEDAKSDPIEYRFGDDMVHGAAKSSSGEVLYVRKRQERESLVRAREHWLPELYRSVETL